MPSLSHDTRTPPPGCVKDPVPGVGIPMRGSTGSFTRRKTLPQVLRTPFHSLIIRSSRLRAPCDSLIRSFEFEVLDRIFASGMPTVNSEKLNKACWEKCLQKRNFKAKSSAEMIRDNESIWMVQSHNIQSDATGLLLQQISYSEGRMSSSERTVYELGYCNYLSLRV
ncbi:hypothetical protein OIU85_020065 [Salix viminalis]|uniref:Uncharacterized protein n=1 Tax=Salix viminalis TaxID=40686 RepID=A0A9Q0ZCA4_SALVM|nr:hypothetical protein OIU85_020065 [Salix viminalis]